MTARRAANNKPLSRRAFMRAAAGAPPPVISSVLVRMRPAAGDAVTAAIAALPGAEVVWRAPDGSKAAVVLEADNDAAVLQCLRDISALPGAVAADLTYTYSEEESRG